MRKIRIGQIGIGHNHASEKMAALRRLSDAIMVGGETVRQDHPQLTVREPESWPRQPLRIIASRSMDDEEVASYFPDGNFERVELETNEEWHSLLIRLGARNITCLLIEGGGELAAAAIDANAVDMVEFHIAPKLLGGRDSRPVLGGNNPESMEFARKLHNVKVTHYGEDIAVSGFLKE